MLKAGLFAAMPLMLVSVPVWAQQPAGDSRFLEQAMVGGQHEVATGEMAETQAERPTVRMFGRWMVTDHTLIGSILDEHAHKAAASPPSGPAGQALAELSKLRGKDFDKRYLADAVAAHEKTVALFEQEAANGQDATLKRIAQDVLPALREHLAQAKQLAGMSAGAPAVQTSLPNPAPETNPNPAINPTNQTPIAKQEGEQGKKRIEVEGK